MPTVTKIPPTEAQRWECEALTPAEIRQLLAIYAGDDQRGLTRIDTAGNAGGEHAWRARVYTANGEIHRQFADSLFGGPAAALRIAIRWRDAERAKLPPKPAPKGVTWRVVRVDYERASGYLAYADRRKFFSANKYGGWGGAKEAAETWLLSRYEGA